MKLLIKDTQWDIVEEGDGESVYLGNCQAGERYCLGLTDGARARVVIHKDLPAKQKMRTLLHELTHAVLDTYGLRYVDLNEETLCEFMAVYGREISCLADKAAKGLKWKQ